MRRSSTLMKNSNLILHFHWEGPIGFPRKNVLDRETGGHRFHCFTLYKWHNCVESMLLCSTLHRCNYYFTILFLHEWMEYLLSLEAPYLFPFPLCWSKTAPMHYRCLAVETECYSQFEFYGKTSFSCVLCLGVLFQFLALFVPLSSKYLNSRLTVHTNC